MNEYIEVYALVYKQELESGDYIGYFSTEELAEKAKRNMIEKKLGNEEELLINKRKLPKNQIESIIDRCEIDNNPIFKINKKRHNHRRILNKKRYDYWNKTRVRRIKD
jgi:hypothetical protein